METEVIVSGSILYFHVRFCCQNPWRHVLFNSSSRLGMLAFSPIVPYLGH